MKNNFLIKFLAISLAAFTLFGCGKEDEAKKLGFSSGAEMTDIHAKGWHTMQRYDEDRAKASGFTSFAAMKQAEATERNRQQQTARDEAEATRAAGNGNEKVASVGVDAGIPPSLTCIFERKSESNTGITNMELNYVFSPDHKFAHYSAMLTETGVRAELSGQWRGGTWSWQNNRLVLAVTTKQNDVPKEKEAYSIIEKSMRLGKDRLDKLDLQRVLAIQDEMMDRPTMQPFRAQISLTQLESGSDYVVYQMTDRIESQSESASRIRCNFIKKEKLVNIDKLMATIFGHSR